MADDELKTPLKARARTTGRIAPKVDGVVLLALVAAGALAVAGVWALFVNDPLGGEPIATASIERRAPERPAGASQAPNGDGHGKADAHEPEPASRDGIPIVRAGEPVPKTGPVIIRVPGAEDASPAKRPAAGNHVPGEVDVAMLEDSRYGKLPRIAADGRRPLDVYGRGGEAPRPRVALIVAGLGVSRDATLTTIKALPAEFALAFAPYGGDVADLVAAARKDGHETLIQAPMEPFAYPSNDPGPQTLLAGLPPPANLERLRWTLGRASGYVGVAPLGGGRFLQADEALAPVFTELARRGLMFVGQAGRETKFGSIAERSGLPYGVVGPAIDATPDAAAIDAALADLERQAKAEGMAIGWASASPLTLKRLDAWRSGLAARGVALAPVTSALKPQGPS